MEDIRYINGKAFISSQDAAERLGVTRATIANRCKRGVLPGQKVNGTWYVAQEACRVSPQQPRVIVTLKKEYRPTTHMVSTVPQKSTDVVPAAPQTSVDTLTATQAPKQLALFFFPARNTSAFVAGIVLSLCINAISLGAFSATTRASLHDTFAGIQRHVHTIATTVSTKTNTITTQSVATVSLGITTLQESLAPTTAQSIQKPDTVSARPSMLARGVHQAPAMHAVSQKLIEAKSLVASTLLSLYQFETVDTAIAHSTNSTWGCIFGFGTCSPEEVVPLRGITMYDIETKKIYCVQIERGEPKTTPGRCTIEDR